MNKIDNYIKDLRYKCKQLTRISNNVPYGKAIEIREKRNNTINKLEFIINLKNKMEMK